MRDRNGLSGISRGGERSCRSLTHSLTSRRFLYRGFEYMPGSDLLSHGEAPHYHRRSSVSLLSSGWVQVVPTRYGRQTNWQSDGHVLRCKNRKTATCPDYS